MKLEGRMELDSVAKVENFSVLELEQGDSLELRVRVGAVGEGATTFILAAVRGGELRVEAAEVERVLVEPVEPRTIALRGETDEE